MKNLFLFLLLAFFPLLTSCDVNDHDGGYISIDSVGVANIDGGGFKMLGEGKNPQITPDSKKIIFSNVLNGIYSVNVDGSGLTCIYQKKSTFYLLLSPDGKRAAFTSDTLKTICLINIDGSGFTQLYGSKYDKFILYFSNDGSKLYFLENGNLSAVDLTGNCQVLSKGPFGSGRDPQITPDGTSVLFYSYSGGISQLVLRNLNTQKDSTLIPCDFVDNHQRPVKFISKSAFLYGYNNMIFSYDMNSGEKKGYITIPNTAKSYSDVPYYYSHDGQKIVYRTYWDKVEVADIDGTAKTALTIPESTAGYCPFQISPDNKKIIFTSVSQKLVQ